MFQVHLRFLIFLALGFCLLCVTSPVVAANIERAFIDQRDVEQMRTNSPDALAALEAGEGAYALGNMEEAAKLFTRASDLAPEHALVFRRKCQALTALGHRAEAVAACDKALLYVGSPMDLRAAVGAAMSGPAPTPEELGPAVLMAEKAVHESRDQPWGYAARCEIASKLGDRGLLEDCVSELQRRAPNHYETRQAAALLPARQSVLSIAAFWISLLSAVLLTLLHSLASRGRRRAARAGAGLVLTLAVSFTPGFAWAGEPEAYPINDKDPASSVPRLDVANKNPIGFAYLVMELGGRAEKAVKANDLPQAIQYFKAIAKAVPDKAVAFSRLCELYEKQGKRAEAIVHCDIAINREGVTLTDYERLVRLVLAKPGKIEPPLIQKLDAVFAHLAKAEGTRVAGALFQCQLAARLEDAVRLGACTKVLTTKLPNDPRAISYQWALALKQQDLARAEAAIERARAVHMPPAAIGAMLEATDAIRPLWSRALQSWRKLLGVLLVAIAAGSLALLLLRRKEAAGAPSL